LCTKCHKLKTKSEADNYGDKNGNVKLSDADVPFIKAFRNAGYSFQQIGDVYGTTKQGIMYVFHNR
jgi:hypothetical protein